MAAEFWVPEFGEPAVGAGELCAPRVDPPVLGAADGEDEIAGGDELPAVGAAEDDPDGPGLADVLGYADREAGGGVTSCRAHGRPLTRFPTLAPVAGRPQTAAASGLPTDRATIVIRGLQPLLGAEEVPMRQTRRRGPGGGDGCRPERTHAGRRGLLTGLAVRGIIPLLTVKFLN